MRQVPVEQQLGLDQERVDVVGRQAVARRRARPAARPATGWRCSATSSVDRGRVALLDRRGRIAATTRFAAEILEQQQPFGEIGVHGSPAPRSRARARPAPSRRTASRPRRDARSRCRACRRAPAARRAGAALHQDEVAAAVREPLVGAGRGVALHALRCASAMPLCCEEMADRGEPLDARRERAVAGDLGVADSSPSCGASVSAMSSRSARQQVGGAVRPFEQHDGVLGRSSKPSSASSPARPTPVEVGMHHGKRGSVVGLHQREGRARHVEPLRRRRDTGSARARTSSCRRRGRPTA